MLRSSETPLDSKGESRNLTRDMLVPVSGVAA